MKILIAEDDKFSQMVISEMATMLYPNVTTEIVSNGKDAYEKIKENKFDLVLSDIDMPEMNGVELVKKIKGELNLKIPVIALTAFAVVGDKEKLLLEGFDDYIPKPIEVEKLKEVLDKYLKN